MGQQAEAEAFCRRIRPRLVGALSLYCGDAALAEDAAQEALAKVWDRWEQVSQMGSPEGWTFRVAFNASHSWVRRIGRARARERRVASSDVAEPPDVVGAIAVRQAVARLPRRQRQVLVLRFFEDLSVAATAEPADDLDVDDLRRRGRRIRRRRRLATAGGTAVVVVLLATGLLVGIGELSGPPDVAVEDGRPVLPDVDRQVVAEGTFDDENLGTWTLEAWTQGGDELCLQGPTGSACAHLMPERNPFRMTSAGTGERDGVPIGCAVGAVRPRVATLEVVFASGTSRLLTPAVNDAFGLRFYATCWTGQRPLREVNGLDADGQQIASVGYDVTVEATESPDPAPERSGPQVQVTEGTYRGSQQPWTLDAWWTTDEQLCLHVQPGQAPSCSPEPDADQPGGLTGWDGSTSFDDGQWSGCATGTVDPAAATVELVFSGGRTHPVTPVEADLQPPATVFVDCWMGHRRMVGARSLDADGRVLDRVNPEMLDRTVEDPVDPATPWLQPGGVGTADADLLRTHDADRACQGSPDATVLEIDWPLDAPPDGQDVRQYARDPDSQLTDRHAADFDADTPLPEDAEYTGYHTDTADLFIDPATAETRIYIVTLDHVEQWPRLTPTVECD